MPVCNSYKKERLELELSDIYKIALYTSASSVGKNTTAYTTDDEVVGAGYVSGGQELSGIQVVQDGDTSVLDWTVDPEWDPSTITARKALIYNDTKAGKNSVAFYDFGSDKTSTGGKFTAKLPAPTAAAGLVRIA